MKNSLQGMAHFLTIGIVTIMSCNAMAKDTLSYQVTDDPVKETKWYETNPPRHITVKTTSDAVIVLQQSYRSEDKLTIVPAHSEKQFEFMEFSECFRFIDESRQVTKKCFQP